MRGAHKSENVVKILNAKNILCVVLMDESTPAFPPKNIVKKWLCMGVKTPVKTLVKTPVKKP